MLSESEDIVRELERRRKRRERLRRRQEEVGGGPGQRRGGDGREPQRLCRQQASVNDCCAPVPPSGECPVPVSGGPRCQARGAERAALPRGGASSFWSPGSFSRDPSMNNARVLFIWKPLVLLFLLGPSPSSAFWGDPFSS